MTTTPALSREEILAAVREAALDTLSIDASGLTETTQLLDVEGFTSAKVVRLAAALEQRLDVELISESAKPWITGKDVVDAVVDARGGSGAA